MSANPEDELKRLGQAKIPFSQPAKVYAAINKVQAALAKEGIGKDRKNAAQGYSFRGIDDVYNALSPLLAQHGLCILPRMLTREVVERESAKGAALFYVTVSAEFDFVSAEDGSRHTVKTYGEAMDSGDKATNKAMSAAYKYAAMQAFAIPTEGDHDTETQTHEVKMRFPKVVASVLQGEEWDAQKVAAIVQSIRDHLESDREAGVFEETEALTQVEKLAVWNVLDSSERSRIKEIEKRLRGVKRDEPESAW